VNEAVRDGDHRGWLAVRHQWEITPRLTFKVDTRSVTDDDVFRDYGDPLNQRSQQRAESNVFLSQRWSEWSFVGNVFWYQDLTERRPVELNRIPDLRLTGVRQPVPGASGLLWELSGSAVRFVRDVGSDGSRVDANPRLSRPISLAGLATLTPFVGGRVTAYDQRVTGIHRGRNGLTTEETEDDLLVRRILEGGTDLESTISRVFAPKRWGFDTVLHTIEPRVNYTWADGRDMDRSPSWTDIDRLGDSHRVEYSLVNRVRARTEAPAGTEPVRFEALRFLVGHSFDVRDGKSGEIVGDLIVQPTPAIRFRGNIREDTHGDGVQVATTDLSAKIDRVSTSIGTRYAQAQHVNFLQGAITAEVSRNLTGRFSTNLDMRTSTFVENRFAADFRFQCYAFTVEYVDRSKAAGKGGEDEIRFALNLLGVGGPVSNAIGLGSLTSSGGKSSQ